jgi:hypothetical protein
MKINRIRLEEVEFMPTLLQPGTLYVSQKYRTAAHLCACGCGEKVRTQLGPLGWHLTKELSEPTLYPSIGSWQKPCRSHYYIRSGQVLWLEQWTDEEVLEGRRAEEVRRDAHFQHHRGGWWGQFANWLKQRP